MPGPLPACSSPAWVIWLIAHQHLHHHTSHLFVIGDIPEPVGAQHQNIVRAVLILREVINPDLAGHRARCKRERQRARGGSCYTGHIVDLVLLSGSGHRRNPWADSQAYLGEAGQERFDVDVGAEHLEVVVSQASRDPYCGHHPSLHNGGSKENFEQLYLQLHPQLRIGDDSTNKSGLKPPKTGKAGNKPPLPSF